ncbi:MAG: serine hydrolase domain-containing protein [Candidatus Heimdallarchaeota archaeon]
MRDAIEIYGYCDDRFKIVKDIFAKNFKLGLEIGASFAVILNGKLVIDLWAGFADATQTRFWEKDTIVNVFSTTKVMTALCIHILVDKGLIDLDAPVANYWPEFAQAGKQELPVRYLLSHTAGLPGFDKEITVDVLYDWNQTVDLLAAQKPWWKPGSRIGYHSITFGYLLGELVRRVTGKTIGTFFRENIAQPLNIDFHIGLSEKDQERVAEIIPPDDSISKLKMFLFKLLFKTTFKVMFNPILLNKDFNSPLWRAAEIPASNGLGNARSIAKVGAILACGGKFNNQQILSLPTIENAIEEQIHGRDIVIFRQPKAWGLGFGLSHDIYLQGPRSFYWSGLGGSYCIMDLEKKLSIGYAMNKMRLFDEPRGESLAQAVWDVINSD